MALNYNSQIKVNVTSYINSSNLMTFNQFIFSKIDDFANVFVSTNCICCKCKFV